MSLVNPKEPTSRRNEMISDPSVANDSCTESASDEIIKEYRSQGVTSEAG